MYCAEDAPGSADVAKADVFSQRRRIDLLAHRTCGDETAQFGTEEDARAAAGEIQRLHAHAVTCKQQASAHRIPQRERKHSAKSAERELAPTSIGGKYHFGVRF